MIVVHNISSLTKKHLIAAGIVGLSLRAAKFLVKNGVWKMSGSEYRVDDLANLINKVTSADHISNMYHDGECDKILEMFK